MKSLSFAMAIGDDDLHAFLRCVEIDFCRSVGIAFAPFAARSLTTEDSCVHDAPAVIRTALDFHERRVRFSCRSFII